MRNFNPVQINKVRSKTDYLDRELYVYYYAPLIFAAIERDIGEDKMWEWIKALLQSPAVMTNYTFLEQTLKKVINDKNKFDLLFSKYLNSDQSLNNVILTLNLKPNEMNELKSDTSLVKKYYYFFFYNPVTDAGSSQNKVIKYTEIKEKTCTQVELSNMSKAIFKKFENECENESGCYSNFNIYDSMEMAQSALKLWLERNNKNGTMLVKILKP